MMLDWAVQIILCLLTVWQHSLFKESFARNLSYMRRSGSELTVYVKASLPSSLIQGDV